MKLSEVLNLSGAQLKAVRPEAVSSAMASDQNELAERFVQALTDAKMRDEKLGEQGKTISLLQSSLDQVSEACKMEAAKRKQLEILCATMESSHAAKVANVEQLWADQTAGMREQATRAAEEAAARIANLEAALNAATAIANRYHSLATNGRAAINASAGILNSVIAEFQIADATAGV